MENKLIKSWISAARELDIDITTSGSVLIRIGLTLPYDVLVRNFGEKNGMIVIKDYSMVKSYLDDILNAGYGFSVLDEPKSVQDYDLSDFIRILSDWGWSGSPERKPLWLLDLPEDDAD